MTHDSTETHSSNDQSRTPDCIRCLRRKLSADGAVLFVLSNASWCLSEFESDIPQEDAEFQFIHLLNIGVPDLIARRTDGLLVNGDSEIQNTFPGVNKLFNGRSIVAAPVMFGEKRGVRLVWRDASDPFTPSDLETLRCHGQCPPDCM